MAGRSKKAPARARPGRAAPAARRDGGGGGDAATRRRVARIITTLEREFPDARCALDYRTPLELLVATILAAQCTDARVNSVTPALFRKYPDAAALAAAPAEALEDAIRSTGFFRNKARAIQRACRAIVERHGGEVPRTMEALLALDGVGRKTANCVLGNAFGVPGIVVDTHVLRLSRRMGLSASRKPDQVERDLSALVPRERWTTFSHLLASLGRTWCKARRPACDDCPVTPDCPMILDK